MKMSSFTNDSLQLSASDMERIATSSSLAFATKRYDTWLRYFLKYDPLPTLKKVTCPVLILFGELDTQVLSSQNGDLMKNALIESGNNDVEVITIPKANHFFQEGIVITKNQEKVTTFKNQFIPDLFVVIKRWIKE